MAEIKIAASSGSGWTSLKGPASTNNQNAFVLPDADGSAGQYLKTDGSKNLGWASDAGKIVNVSQVVKTDAASASTAQGAYSSDLISLSYAASSSSNKLLIICSVSIATATVANVSAALFIGGSASAFIGDASSNRVRVSSSAGETASTMNMSTQPIIYLLSSPSTSSTTYSVRGHHAQDATQNIYINRTHYDADANYTPRAASSITIIEVAA